MKTISLFAAVALLSVPVQAQTFSFEVNGRQVRVAVPKNCDSDQCVSISTRRSNGADAPSTIDGADVRRMLSDFLNSDSPQDAPVEAPAARTVRTPPVSAPAPVAPSVGPSTPETTPAPVAAPAPAENLPPPVRSEAPASAPPVYRWKPKPAPAPIVAPTPPAPPQPVRSEARAPAPPVPAPVPQAAPAAPSPEGVWVTQNKEGRVHIVPCGPNYCGYAFDESNRDGAKVLLDMRPTKRDAWSGRVRDPKGGGIYDATITLRGPDVLAVRGCAFGGMICRGQTWKRV